MQANGDSVHVPIVVRPGEKNASFCFGILILGYGSPREVCGLMCSYWSLLNDRIISVLKKVLFRIMLAFCLHFVRENLI